MPQNDGTNATKMRLEDQIVWYDKKSKRCQTRNLSMTLRHQGAARRANVKPGVHILRHTFCSHLAMRGAPARAIQELAGHQDLATTQRYMHLSPAALDAAIRLLEMETESRGGIVEAAGVEPASGTEQSETDLIGLQSVALPRWLSRAAANPCRSPSQRRRRCRGRRFRRAW